MFCNDKFQKVLLFLIRVVVSLLQPIQGANHDGNGSSNVAKQNV